MSVETLERELINDLSQVEQERFSDEKFCTELYRALTATKLRKPGVTEGHVVLSFNQAESAINHLRRNIGAEPLTLAQTGDEGEVDSTVLDVLGGRGWSFAPASADAGDPMHDQASASPPPAAQETPEWERQAHEEADAEIRRRSA
jgi:hypothetical protein